MKLLKTDAFSAKATSKVYAFVTTSGQLPPISESIGASFLITVSGSQQNGSLAVFYYFKPNYFILIQESFKSSSSFASPLTSAQK